jgi:phosphoribosylformimino-5-aminoimidazole carboxamide ribotide isomerase
MRIIPAIDLIEGKCVRLTQGDYARKKIYNEDPLEVALSFADAGLEYLHLVDLDGAKAGKVVNWKTLEKLTSKTPLKIDFGGGIKTGDDLRVVFESGAVQATAGSIAVKDREEVARWIGIYGSEKIIIGLDVKEGKIATAGWMETSEEKVSGFLDFYVSAGARYTVSTDVAKDGMMQGPAFQWYDTLMSDYPALKVVASGGIRGMDDLLHLREMGLDGAIIGKAIYEGAVTLQALSTLC